MEGDDVEAEILLVGDVKMDPHGFGCERNSSGLDRVLVAASHEYLGFVRGRECLD